MSNYDLMAGPPTTRLPDNVAARELLENETAPREVAAAHPDCSLAWALLAEEALDAGEAVAAYAYARTGYHRGLDQLRRAGWKGHGPVPWEHPPNRGFLRALGALARAADSIGETPEGQRCAEFLADSSPTAAAALGFHAPRP